MDFIDRFGKKVADAGTNIMGKVSELGSASGYTGEIAAKEKEITELYTKIGKFYYENKKETIDSVCKADVDAIDTKIGELKILKQHLNAARHIIVCSECHEENSDTAKFCNKCGKPLPARYVSPNPGEVLCQNCGNVITPGTKFCNKCGTPVPEDKPAEPTANKPAEKPEEKPEDKIADEIKIEEPDPDLVMIDIDEPEKEHITPEAPKARFCPECGTVLEEDATFCANCGTRI